jgi:hypothetical protein
MTTAPSSPDLAAASAARWWASFPVHFTAGTFFKLVYYVLELPVQL